MEIFLTVLNIRNTNVDTMSTEPCVLKSNINFFLLNTSVFFSLDSFSVLIYLWDLKYMEPSTQNFDHFFFRQIQEYSSLFSKVLFVGRRPILKKTQSQLNTFWTKGIVKNLFRRFHSLDHVLFRPRDRLRKSCYSCEHTEEGTHLRIYLLLRTRDRFWKGCY